LREKERGENYQNKIYFDEMKNGEGKRGKKKTFFLLLLEFLVFF